MPMASFRREINLLDADSIRIIVIVKLEIAFRLWRIVIIIEKSFFALLQFDSFLFEDLLILHNRILKVYIDLF